jgi:lysozyme family protein
MKLNFSASLTLVLQHEGGFVDDPQDPGGRTNRGVTQAVYDDWRVGEGLVRRDVKLLNDYEVGAIYRKRYWDACRCDDLPVGVDYCVFDFAVNSGVNRACRYLQRAVGVADDGQVGAMTIGAAAAIPAIATIEKVCAARLNFLKQLPTFARFGKGWTTRVQDVCARAKVMVG